MHFDIYKSICGYRWGVKGMKESAHKIEALAVEAPREHALIFLAHNGPTGRKHIMYMAHVQIVYIHIYSLGYVLTLKDMHMLYWQDSSKMHYMECIIIT